MKKKKDKPAELKIRKPLPDKVGGPMTSKKGKRGYDRRRDMEIPQEKEEDRK